MSNNLFKDSNINEESRVKKAQDAFKSKDVELSKKIHDSTKENHNIGHGKYLKSIVYGGLDGIITTFAVVAGVKGASLTPNIILILGFANLFADGISMSVGDYLSTKSEQEYNKEERRREIWEFENYPQGEINEMVEFYMEKGMSSEDANIVVPTMAKYKDLFIDHMMVEELGILEDDESPIKNALFTFFSFLICGFVPLATTVYSLYFPDIINDTFTISSIMTAVMLFILGYAKGIVSGVNKIKSGIEILLLGGLAATAAYFVGQFLGK